MQHLKPNTTLQGGKYRIERVLGQGGFGITYLAEQVSSNRQVAIKEFFLDFFNERTGNSIRVSNSTNDSLFEKLKEKFKKAAICNMSLDNEHIVKLYDLFEENNTAYYVMDYVEGETLYDLMKRNDSPMTELEVKRLLPQMLDALNNIHNASLLNLSLKPGNIMVNKSGKIFLVGFENSIYVNSKEEMSFTYGYAPYEQIEQNCSNIGPWSDIYALGATLYNLLTNKRPPSPSKIDSDESDDKHVSLPLYNISRGMKSLILLMMKTNWEQRPKTIDELSLLMQKELYGKDNHNMQHLQPNTPLQGGKYRIERVLGQGGFGITYLAIKVSSNRQVAIKELFLNGVNERTGNSVQVSNSVNDSLFEKQKEKFKKEAKRIMSLDNEHIVKVYDLFEENDTVYYVMDYLEGESLASKMKREGHPLTESEVMDILPQLLDALSEIHKFQIWHLDIKPANIMLIDKTVVLIDFGASKQITPSEMTSTALYFTPGYAPAEQTGMLFNQFGPWTDLYAVGATIFNLLTGKSPLEFDIEEFKEDDLPESNWGLMYKMINWMMQPRRKERPQRAVDVKQKYYADFVSIGLITILKDIFNKQIVKTIGEDIDIVKDLGGTKSQVETIKKEVNEWFGVDIEGCPMTHDFIAVTILQQLGWIFIQSEIDYGEDSTDEDDIDWENLLKEQNMILDEREDQTVYEGAQDGASPIANTISVNGHEAVDLGLSVLWATMDVGAPSEDGYGECYLWGDPDGEKTRKVRNSFLARWFKGGPIKNKICGDPQYDTATCLWGKDWRMPTGKEFEELATQCTWELVDKNHARITGPNGNSIVLDNRYHWTGESPFGNIVMFSWNHNNDDILWGFPSMQRLGKDYTDLFFPVRAVSNK